MISSKSLCVFTSNRIPFRKSYGHGMNFTGKHRLGLFHEQGATHKTCLFSSSTNTSTKGKPSVLELIKGFPYGFLDLLNSYYLYRNVIDASKTPVNAWSKLGHVPRRQAEQVRSFKRDFKKVLLPVSFAAIPVIGNLIFIPIAMNPSPFLSNHFLRGYETSLAKNDYSIRSQSYESCLNGFKTFLGYDASIETDQLFGNLQKHDNLSWSKMSRKHIQSLARAYGISHFTSNTFPSFYLTWQLDTAGKDIFADNLDLIQESHHLDFCQRLTDEEVLEACHIRGLPVDDKMRSSLCKYLCTMEKLFLDIKSNACRNLNGTDSERDIIITLHLAVLVYKSL